MTGDEALEIVHGAAMGDAEPDRREVMEAFAVLESGLHHGRVLSALVADPGADRSVLRKAAARFDEWDAGRRA